MTGSKLSIYQGEPANLGQRPLFDYLREAAEQQSKRPWLIQNNIKLSYQDSLSTIDAICAGLAKLGINKGDRVGICMPNCIAYPLFSYACWRQGIIVSGFTALYPEPMIKTLIEDSTPKLVVTVSIPELSEKVLLAAKGSCPVLLLENDGSNLSLNRNNKRPPTEGAIYFEDFIADCNPPAPVAIDAKNDLAMLQFTGGTTGKPKGVMLTHYNISSCIEQFKVRMHDLRPGKERYIATGPFSHIMGSAIIMGTCTALASSLYIPARFHPEETTQYILDNKISFLVGVPTMLQAIAQSKAALDADWNSLTYCFSGGSPLPIEVSESFRSVTNTEIIQGYGLSETASGISFTQPATEQPPSAVGFALANCRVEIRNPSNLDDVLPLGEAGEVCFSGPQVMKGYWNHPEATKKTMHGDLLLTGDIGMLNENGVLFIVDRIKDIIIASGFNVYPSQVENAILTHPAILEAAVVGEKDPYRGETVKAIVAFKPDNNISLESLQLHLKNLLSPIEMPKILHVLDTLPKTPVGKIDKKML